jgi:hemerythrin-like domain-containing protein
MHPIEQLRDEHRAIRKVLDALELRIEELDGAPFPRAFFDRAVDFLTVFADGFHRHREERGLFPLLESRGVARHGAAIGACLGDHDFGRIFLNGIRENLDAAEGGSPGALAAIRDCAGSYIDILRAHIRREDEVLFPIAEKALTANDAEDLRRRFNLVAAPEQCRTFAEEIA